MRHLIVFLALSSCIRSSEVSCADGRVCPPGNTCDDANARCISPDQVAACTGLADGSACTFADVPGVCHAGACDPLLCGDGVRTGTEACDGSDLGSADCTAAGYYDPAGLACTPFCTFDTTQCVGRCGDGIVNGPELCDGAPPDGACVDDGFDAGPLDCSTSCGASFSECARFGWTAAVLPIAMPSGVAGTGVNDVWVVGAGSAVAHFDGNRWSSFPTSASQLDGAWAIAPDDVWAVGDSVVHWDGSGWSAVAGVPAATYSDVWAAGSAAVYVATKEAGVLAWDGTMWQTLGSFPGGAIQSLRGSSATDIWAADNTAVWHWTGATWTMALSAHANNIAVVDAGDVWISGYANGTFASLIAMWNGQSWTQWTTPLTGLYGLVAATAPNNVWVTSPGDSSVYHYDGVSWTLDAPFALAGRMGPDWLLALGPAAVVGISLDGLAYRYHGQSYVRFDPTTNAPWQQLWMDTGDDLFASFGSDVVHYDGTSWTTAGIGAQVADVFGTGSDNVWASGAEMGTLYRYDAATQQWPLMYTIGSMNPVLWGTGPMDMWAVAGSTAVHYDGAVWTPYVAAPFTHVSGTGSNDIWGIVLDQIWHWDGMSWQAAQSPSSTTYVGVVATAPGHVVVIDGTSSYAWDGASWSSQPLPFTDTAFTLVGTAGDFLVAASSSELAHFDGSRWSPMQLPPDASGHGTQIAALVATPNMIGVIVETPEALRVIRALQRTQPWVCEAKETDCTNGVDDDCDGLIDAQDPDCL